MNDWDEVFFRLLVQSFGFHVNTFPFNLLAQSTPYKVVRKHGANLLELEALLFGQAGFLQDDYNEDDIICVSKDICFSECQI
jgi:hypothetical protein